MAISFPSSQMIVTVERLLTEMLNERFYHNHITLLSQSVLHYLPPLVEAVHEKQKQGIRA